MSLTRYSRANASNVAVAFKGAAVGAAELYVLLAKRRTDGRATTWKFELQSRLPVSKHTFERIAAGTAAAMARPQISEATRAQLNQLERARGVFVSVYRVLFISVGLVGLTAGILLLRSHTPANMLGLYGAIVVLFSLGALLNGIVPGPSVVPMEPLDRVYLDQLKEKTKVQVLQFLAAGFELPFPEWSVALHLLSGFISICRLTGGLEAIPPTLHRSAGLAATPRTRQSAAKIAPKATTKKL